MQYSPPIGYLIRQSVQRFVTLSLLLTGLIVLLRFYEIAIISGKAGYPSESIFLILYGIRFDLILALRLSALMLIPYLLIDYFSPVVARVLFAAGSLTAVMAELLLLQYFAVNKIPYGANALTYSPSDISQIINASGGSNMLNTISMVVLLLIVVFAFVKWSTLKFSPQVTFWVTCLAILSLLPLSIFNPESIDFRNDFRKNITANKLNLCCSSVMDYRFGENSFYLFITNTTKKTGKESSSN